MTKSFIAFIFIISFISCNKSKEDNSLSEKDPSILVTKYPNTKLVAMKVQIKDERYDGKFEAYYRSGKKKADGLYKAGRINGYYIRYREDGSIISKENYKNGKLDSLNQYFREDGSLEHSQTYYGGQEHGPYKSYYPNGNIYQDFNYVYGRREGTQQVFYPNKKLKWKDTYENGYTSGNYVSFTEAGNKILHGYSIVCEEVNEIKLANKFTYKFKLNKPSKEVEFFMGEIVNGKRDYRTVTPLKKNGNWYEKSLNIKSGHVIIANTFVIAAFLTKDGHETTIVKDLKVALTNF